MDGEYWRYAMRDKPKFNEKVCRGYVGESLKDVVQYIDRFIRSTSSSFPDNFRYKGIKVLGPFEQYRRSVLLNEVKREYDLAQTDWFLTELTFEFDDKGDVKTIERELWLPYCRQGNTTMIKGSLATLHPVLADRLISVTQQGLFFIIQRAKFNLDKKDYIVLRDGEIFTSIMLEAYLHNDAANKKQNDKWAGPTTGHYLFAKYGVVEAFRIFYKVDVYICESTDIDPRYDPDIHYKFSSKERHGRKKLHRVTDFVMIVPRDAFDKEPGVANLVMSFFYATDYYNDSFQLADIERPDDWLKTLAYAIFREKGNLGTQLTKIMKHMDSLEDYIDEMTHEVIVEEGLEGIETIYDLLVYANDNVIHLMNTTDVGSMWGKYLMVKRYVLSSITFQIINLSWTLKKDKDALTLKMVKWRLGSNLHPNSYLGIIKDHGEKTNVQYPGDNMLIKHTMISIRQIDAVVSSSGKSKSNPNDPAYQFHPSILDSGSVVNFPKREPDGRSKLNPFITIDSNGKILPNPKYREKLEAMKEEMKFNN